MSWSSPVTRHHPDFLNHTVDLSKLRLSDSSGSESGAYTDTLNSPDLDDYTSMVSGGQPVMGGFCCATFPLTRGLARTIKRLWWRKIVFYMFSLKEEACVFCLSKWHSADWLSQRSINSCVSVNQKTIQKETAVDKT